MRKQHASQHCSLHSRGHHVLAIASVREMLGECKQLQLRGAATICCAALRCGSVRRRLLRSLQLGATTICRAALRCGCVRRRLLWSLRLQPWPDLEPRANRLGHFCWPGASGHASRPGRPGTFGPQHLAIAKVHTTESVRRILTVWEAGLGAVLAPSRARLLLAAAITAVHTTEPVRHPQPREVFGRRPVGSGPSWPPAISLPPTTSVGARSAPECFDATAAAGSGLTSASSASRQLGALDGNKMIETSTRRQYLAARN